MILTGAIMNSLKVLLSSLTLLLMPVVVFAQSITLYEQPNQNAKVVGTADLSAGIISIFSPDNNNEWMKVGDPRNGNVGWIKTNDLKNAKGSESIITQKVITKNPSDSAQILQFGNAPTLTKEQAQALLLEYQAKQVELQKTLKGAINDLNTLFQSQINMNIQAIPPKPVTPAKQTNPQPANK
jgi:hypothetical protein